MGDTTVSMGNNSGMPSTGLPEGQQLMPLNGDDIKQSPASTPRGVNGGTPAPGSAQSGQPSSGTPGQSFPADDKPGSNSKMVGLLSPLSTGHFKKEPLQMHQLS